MLPIRRTLLKCKLTLTVLTADNAALAADWRFRLKC